MTDIPNNKYVTVNEYGIFVGGKPEKTGFKTTICY